MTTISEPDLPDALHRLHVFLAGFETPALANRCLTEAYFSNTLAWYLDPHGSHGFGDEVATEFLKIVAKARSENSRCTRRASHLKWKKQGAGRGATGFALGNSAVVRELFLSGEIERGATRGNRYCDLALFDLDSADGLFVAVENKLFTTNRPGQLSDYHQAIEDRFDRAATREFVFLTLRGDPPVSHSAESDADFLPWLPIGWTTHLLQLFEELLRKYPAASDLSEFLGLLKWIRALTDAPSWVHPAIEDLRQSVLIAAIECLRDELERLRGAGRGHWERNGHQLIHTSTPARALCFDLLPNCSVTIQTRVSGRAKMVKILIPFAAHPDQVFNLLCVAARDVYAPKCYFEKPNQYLSDRRRRTAIRTDRENRTEPLFRFAHAHRLSLQILLALNSAARTSAAASIGDEAELGGP